MTGHESPSALLRLPARPESLPALRDLALRAAAGAGLPEEQVQRLELVLEEALMNIFRHAYPGGAGDVELSCRAEPSGRVCLTLRDWGGPFDPLNTSDPELEAGMAANLEAGLEERVPGGLGLFLIRSMSEASYAREAGANVLRFCVGP